MNIRLARAETDRQIFDLKRWMNEPNEKEERGMRGRFILYRVFSFLPYDVIGSLPPSEKIWNIVHDWLEERFGLPKPDRRGYKGVGEEAGPKGDLS